MMSSRKSFWLATLAVVAVGLVAGATVADRIIHKPVQSAEAAWAEIFQTPAALAQSVDVVALAQAMEVTPGRVAHSDLGEGPLPFQLIEFEVLHALRGTAAGERVTVERAGSAQVQITADGGELVPGEVYLLFLKQQPDGDYYYQVNHQGRYHLRGDHFIAVAPDDPVATRLHGASMEQGLARVRAALDAPRASTPMKK